MGQLVHISVRMTVVLNRERSSYLVLEARICIRHIQAWYIIHNLFDFSRNLFAKGHRQLRPPQPRFTIFSTESPPATASSQATERFRDISRKGANRSWDFSFWWFFIVLLRKLTYWAFTPGYIQQLSNSCEIFAWQIFRIFNVLNQACFFSLILSISLRLEPCFILWCHFQWLLPFLRQDLSSRWRRVVLLHFIRYQYLSKF